jgi:AraC family transcriptional regulator
MPDNAIATLHRGSFGTIEFLRCNGAHAFPAHSAIATRLHFSLPLLGSFVWHVGREAVFADPTALLRTDAGESFRITHPHGGDESLVITPSPQVLAELSERTERAKLLGRRRAFIAPARAQLIAHALSVDPMTAGDGLTADECLMQLFESMAAGGEALRAPRDGSLVRRALEYVHDTAVTQLSLQAIATALDVRASYLTHAFTRCTGQPLYRYVTGLKLVRALQRIGTTRDDLTHIALDLGFNSHSHLSAAFKARYGLSPSQWRHRGRPGQGRRSGQRSEARIDQQVSRRLNWRPLCAARGGDARLVGD